MTAKGREWMDLSLRRDLLSHQLRTVEWRAGAEGADIVDSVRRTKAWALGVDVDSAPLFVWKCPNELSFLGHDIPLSGEYLFERFVEAGVIPSPGQSFLLAPELVVAAVTESLDRLADVRQSVERALATLGAWSRRGGSSDPGALRSAIQHNEDDLKGIESRASRLIAARNKAEELLKPPPRRAASLAA